VTIASVQTAAAQSDAGASSVSTTYASTPTAGNMLICAVAFDKDAGTITPPSGWGEVFRNSGTSVSIWVGWKISAGTESTVTAGRSNTAGMNGDTLWLSEFSDSASGNWTILTSTANYSDNSSVKSWASGTVAAPGRACAAITFFGIDSTQMARTSQAFSNSYATLRAWVANAGNYRADMAVGWLSAFAGGSTTSSTHTHEPDADQVTGAIFTFCRVASAVTVTPSPVLGSVAIPAPTVTAVSGPLADPVLGVASVPAPTATAGAAATATPVAGAVAVSDVAVLCEKPLYIDDHFTGSDGDPLGAAWASSAATAGTSATINGNRLRLNSGSATGYAGKKAIRFADGPLIDTELYGLINYPDLTDCRVEVWARTPGPTDDSSTGYFANMPRSGTIGIGKAVAYTYTDLGTASVTIPNATDYRFRFRCVGTSIKLKVWAAAGAEPSSWSVEVTDSAITGQGYNHAHLQGGNTAGGVVDFDDIRLTNGTETATPSAVAGAVTIPAATPGIGATATPSAVAGAATIPAPTVTGNGATATPSAVAVAATIPTPSVTAGAVAMPGQVATAVAIPAATASAGVTAVATAVAGVATVPAMSGTASATATPAVATGVATVPAMSGTASVMATAVAIAATASIPAPTVTGSGSIATPGAVSGVATIPAPVATAGVSGAATPVAVAATVPAVTIAAGAVATPGRVATAVAIPVATAVADAVATPGQVATAVAIPGATATAGAGTVATPGQVATAVTIPVATVTADAVATATPVATAVAIPAATASAGSGTVATPSAIVATATIPAPDVSASKVATPSAVAGQVSIPTVTATAEAVAAPASVAGTVAIPVPSVVAGTADIAAPQPVIVYASIPTPAGVAEATAGPAGVDGSVAIPDPTVTAASSVSPAELVAVVTVPAPAVVAEAGASPSALTGTTTIPTPTVLAGVSAVASPSPVEGSVLVAAPTLTVVRTPVGSGGWYGLLSIVREAEQIARAEANAPTTTCPDDGEVLLAAPGGGRFCRFCGWRTDGR
jgi:hypothetical protein